MLLAVISLLLNTASIFRSAKEKDAAESGYNGLVAEYSGGEGCEVVVDLGYVKRSAVAPEMLVHEGPAKVYESEEEAIVVTLEQASDKDSYYIHFANEGYLHATDAKAGKLTFTSSPEKAWSFTPYDYGFLVVQQGEIGVKIICSEHASDRLLRSMSSEIEEEGGAIALFRKK